MASSNIKHGSDEHDKWATAQAIHNPHEWDDSSDDDDVDNNNDNQEFFDAHEEDFNLNATSSTTASKDTELLHERLNEKLSTDEAVKKKVTDDPYYIDEELLADCEKLLSEEDREKRHSESQVSKNEGNDLFTRGQYDKALEKYSEALHLCPMKYARDRSVLYANRAACLMKLEKYEAAVQSCTKSIEFDATYVKPLLRRAESYKKIDKLEEALQDYQKILTLEPNHAQARHEVYILPDQIKERNEKLKEEMLGKLKELGNMVLKPFGLSTNNFKLQQDPTTGSYSVNFQK